MPHMLERTFRLISNEKNKFHLVQNFIFGQENPIRVASQEWQKKDFRCGLSCIVEGLSLAVLSHDSDHDALHVVSSY